MDNVKDAVTLMGFKIGICGCGSKNVIQNAKCIHIRVVISLC